MRAAGVSRALLSLRLSEGWERAAAVSTPPHGRKPARRPRSTPEDMATMAAHGVSRALLALRLKRGWPRAAAISTPPPPRRSIARPRVVGHGERRDDGWRLDAWESSLTAFAGGHGVQRVTLFARLERGWPATIAATVGVDPSPPWTDTEREAVEAARSRGISRPCVLHRLRAGWSLDAATTTPSKRSPK